MIVEIQNGSGYTKKENSLLQDKGRQGKQHGKEGTFV